MDLFKNLRPEAKNQRNAFDTSRRDVFSAKTGMLTPCFCVDTIPDSVYDVNVLSLVRTDSVQTASFARMSQNVEYFFLPYSQIFRDFDKVFYERGDNQRNVSNQSGLSVPTHVPFFDLGDVLFALYAQYVFMRLYEKVELEDAKSDSQSYEYWIKRRGDLSEAYIYNTSRPVLIDVHGRHCVEDSLRILDNLGYGNYLPVFKSCYALVAKKTQVVGYYNELVDALFATQNYNPQDLNSPLENYIDEFTTDDYFQAWYSKRSGRYCSVLRLAAYLKVWADYFRNTQYDVNTNYAYYFNYDYVVNDSFGTVPTDKVLELLKPRYRQYKKDVFTGSFPTAQFGSVAVAMTENPVNISNSDVPANFSNLGVGGQSSLYPGQVVVGAQGATSLGKWSIDSSLSALSMRQALALQRYKERILRAGNRDKYLQRAVFGDVSRYVLDEYVDFLGAVHSSVDFNSVAATAEGENHNVGELSANGVSTYGGDGFRYNSHDHGIIIGLFYVLPETEYEAYGLDRFVTMSESSDFFKPDFQNLGLAPVFGHDFNFLSFDLSQSTPYADSVLGYLARYWQYKTAVDKVHGEFYSNSPLYVPDVVAAGSQLPAFYQDYLAVSIGAFAEFVTPRNSQAFLYPVLRSLYVSPTDVDRIFYAFSDVHQASDQFKVNMSHQVKCVLPMSVIGLPL